MQTERILYIAPIRLPTEKAHGIQIMETCAALTRAGASVELAVSTRPTHIVQDAFAYYGIREHFPIHRISARDTVRYGRLGYILYALTFAIRAAVRARRTRPSVVYTRDPLTLIVLALLGVKPLVWEVHAEHPGVPSQILSRIDALIPITRGLAGWYESRGFLKERIHVAPDAVDLDAFVALGDREIARRALRERLGIAPDAKIALYLGSFGTYSWKGVDVAREAAESAPGISWLFVGGSDAECEQLKRDAPSHVFTLPRASRGEVPALLCAADVLLLPNKKGDIASERDTSPMKLFEYMAAGVPIVASDLASLREVLSEQSAYFVEPNNPRALARSVETALSDAQGAARRAAAARSSVEQYTWDARAHNILSFLNTLHVRA